MRVGIDLDGCVYDFGGAFREYLVALGYRTAEECPEPTRWEFYEDWGFTTAEFLQHCHEGVDEGIIFRGAALAGAKEAFDLLRSAGHTIHIVTDRSFGSGEGSPGATRAWLAAHGLEFDSLTFARDKTLVKVDVMVEDKIENYDALVDAGVLMFLIDRPWNHRENDTRNRVSGILEFAQEVVAHG